MAKRRELQQRVVAFTEIEGILGTMKNLALMEMQKLTRFVSYQRRAVQSIEAAAVDFFSFYLASLPQPRRFFDVHLLIGSERGFCGDFNEHLFEVAAAPITRAQGETQLMVVGGRLAVTLERNGVRAMLIPGAAVAEEAESVLGALAEALGRLQQECGDDRLMALTVVYHDDESGEVKSRRLLPMPDLPKPASPFSYPPMLNLAPLDLLGKLVDHYLYAVLHEVLYSSLLAENRQRLTHMDNVIHRLDEDIAKLKLKCNAQRQEEIIEDIEVILLSVDALVGER